MIFYPLILGLDEKVMLAIVSLLGVVASAFFAKYFTRKSESAKAMKEMADARRIDIENENLAYKILQDRILFLQERVHEKDTEINKLEKAIETLEGTIVAANKEIKAKSIEITFLKQHQTKY